MKKTFSGEKADLKASATVDSGSRGWCLPEKTIILGLRSGKTCITLPAKFDRAVKSIIPIVSRWFLSKISWKREKQNFFLSRGKGNVIPLNIAEGQGRMHGKEKRQFYNTARGSLLECIPLIQACHQLGYFNFEKYKQIYSLAEEVSKMLAGLIKSVKCE